MGKYYIELKVTHDQTTQTGFMTSKTENVQDHGFWTYADTEHAVLEKADEHLGVLLGAAWQEQQRRDEAAEVLLEKKLRAEADAKVRADNANLAKPAEFPRQDGDVTLLGPGTILSDDEKVISHKGENFYSHGPTRAEAAAKMEQRAQEAVDALRADRVEQIGTVERPEGTYIPPQQLTPNGPVHGGFTVIENNITGEQMAAPQPGSFQTEDDNPFREMADEEKAARALTDGDNDYDYYGEADVDV